MAPAEDRQLHSLGSVDILLEQLGPMEGDGPMHEDELPQGLPVIDDIYELLEGLEYDEAALKKSHSNKLTDIFEHAALFNAVVFLIEQGYGHRLGLSSMDLAKFEQLKGRVNETVLRGLATRSRSLLKELEGELRRISAVVTGAQPESAEQALGEDSGVLEVSAVQWVVLPRDENAELIAEISALLERAVEAATSTNLPPDRRALSQMQRAQLVAILQTAVAMLQAPLVEKGLLKKVAEAARTGAANTVEKQTEMALGIVLAELVKQIGKLFGLL